jgi:large subunit ribosomal protein L9
MKVLLRSDVQGVGRRGDIVEVKSGYARNFLLPTGAALLANDTMEVQASSMRRAAMSVTRRVAKQPSFSAR